MKVITTVLTALVLFACTTAPATAANGENTAMFLDLAKSLITDEPESTESPRESDANITGPVSAPDPAATAIASLLTLAISKYPVASSILGVFIALLPLLQLLANWTKNPKDNAALILINKVLQTLTLTRSGNQLNSLPWSTLLTTKPKHWPEEVRTEDARKIYQKVYE